MIVRGIVAAAVAIAGVSFFTAPEASAQVLLTSMGQDPNGNTVWRIRNQGDEVVAVRLRQNGGGFQEVYNVQPYDPSAPGGDSYEIFVTSTCQGTPCTHIADEGFLDENGDFVAQGNSQTKAAGPQPFSPIPTNAALDTAVEDNSSRIDDNDGRITSLEDDFDGLETRVSNIEDEIDDLKSGIASATAIGAMQQDPGAEGLQLSLGVGFYDGESAGAVMLGGQISPGVYVGAAGATGFNGEGATGAVTGTINLGVLD